jgi:hypothetical protein
MDNIFQFFAFLFLSCGISVIWSLSDIFLKTRNFVAKKIPNPIKKMLLCMECSSFWIGVIVSIIFFPILGYIVLNEYLNYFCGGVITHLFVKICNRYEVFEKLN